MPKRPIDILNFDKGIISNFDKNDIPIGAFAWGTDGVRTNTKGKIKGYPALDDLRATYSFRSNVRGEFFTDSTGDIHYVYYDGTNVKIIEDFHGTPSTSSYTGASSSACMIKLPNGVAIGRGQSSKPLYATYVESAHQVSGASPQVYMGQMAINGIGNDQGDVTANWSIGSITETASSDNPFVGGTQYSFAYAISYEGNYTPLATITSYSPAVDCKLNFRLTISDFAKISPRTDNIIIFVRETAVGGAWRYLTEYSLRTGTWTTSVLTKYKDFTNVQYNPQESYDAITGISAAVVTNQTDLAVSFSQGCMLNGSLFLYGKTSFINEPVLYKTNPNFYGLVDVTNEFLYLNQTVSDIFSYGGKVYLIGENKLVRINFNLFIEDITQGTNTESKVLVTEYGAFWAYKNKAFQLLGNKLNVISDNVEDRLTALSLKIAGWDGINSEVYFGNYGGSSCFVYNVMTREWAYRSNLIGQAMFSLITDIYGNMYVGATDGLYKIDDTNTAGAYTVYTGNIGNYNPSQDKKFYKMVVENSGSITTFAYDLDNSGTYTTLTGTGGVYELKSAGEWLSGKQISFKIITSAEIRGMSLIVRDLIGTTHV